MGTAELVQDKNLPGTYRVECINDEGGCEVATFSGPGALVRASYFAGNYYEKWSDPTDLLENGRR